MFISMVRLAFTSTCFLLSFPFHGETSPNRRLPQPGSTGAKNSACAKIARWICWTQNNIWNMWMLHLNDMYDINMHQHVPMLHQNMDASDTSLSQNLLLGFLTIHGHTKTYQNRILRPWHHLTSYHRTRTVEHRDSCWWPGIEVKRFTSPSCHPSQARHGLINNINKWTRRCTKWNKDLFNAAM